MTPSIKTLPETQLIGQHRTMSFMNDQTLQLWQNFMPRCREVKQLASPDLLSVEVYPDNTYFRNFKPTKLFVKWAAVAVTGTDFIPSGMEVLTIPEGDYAVFNYVGKASQAPNFYRFIFEEWLPKSGYVLADRPHFSVMGAKYKGEAEDSEEQIWIPVTATPFVEA